MIRFLHTADVQLGMRALEAPAVAEQVRAHRFDTLASVMDLAKRERVDFVLIAGDLFEDNQVSAETAYRAARILQDASPVAVYVLPGNHDPLTAGSVYYRTTFRDRCPDNVTVLGTEEPVLVADGAALLYPCPVREPRSLADPTARLPGRVPQHGSTIAIGVAHGSLRIEGRYSLDDHPIALDAAEQAGLDYLALGHWHSHYRHGERACYPGSPEPTGFGERDSGGIVLVSIQEPGAVPQVDWRRTGRLQWLTWEREVSSDLTHPLEELQREVTALSAPDRTLLRIVLRGTASSDSLRQIGDFEDWLLAQGLLHAEVRRQLVVKEHALSALSRLAEGDAVIAAVLADLQQLAALGTGSASSDAAGPTGGRSIDDLFALWDTVKGQEKVERSEVVAEAMLRLAVLAEEVTR